MKVAHLGDHALAQDLWRHVGHSAGGLGCNLALDVQLATHSKVGDLHSEAVRRVSR